MENEQTFQKKINGLPKRSSNYMSLKHMKSLIVLVVGLLSVGCLTPEQKLRDSIVGEYEAGVYPGHVMKFVFLDNGVREWYQNGEKDGEGKWKIVDGAVHILDKDGITGIFRINIDGSLTIIAAIRDGKRTAYPKKSQHTWKKLKE